MSPRRPPSTENDSAFFRAPDRTRKKYKKLRPRCPIRFSPFVVSAETKEHEDGASNEAPVGTPRKASQTRGQCLERCQAKRPTEHLGLIYPPTLQEKTP